VPFSKSQIHLDLETLGIRESSKILSIGAVHMANTFYRELDITLYNGMPVFTQDQSTIDWWEEQGGFQPQETPISPYNAIAEFNTWVQDCIAEGADEVWANSPTFDCDMLRFHMDALLHADAPWMFWQERDVRTLKALARSMRVTARSYKNPHHALVDAQNQRNYVLSVYGSLANTVERAKEAPYELDVG
jgi:hypothetical protein